MFTVLGRLEIQLHRLGFCTLKKVRNAIHMLHISGQLVREVGRGMNISPRELSALTLNHPVQKHCPEMNWGNWTCAALALV